MHGEDKKFAVVLCFPEHPGWWRVVAYFHTESRAERYATVENDCLDDENDHDGDESDVAPANATPEPPSLIGAKEAAPPLPVMLPAAEEPHKEIRAAFTAPPPRPMLSVPINLDRRCARCDKPITGLRATRHKTKYCSPDCAAAAAKDRLLARALAEAGISVAPNAEPPNVEAPIVVEKWCEWCGETIPPEKAHKDNAKFCSPQCLIAAQNDRHLEKQKAKAEEATKEQPFNPFPRIPETITVEDACDFLRTEMKATVTPEGKDRFLVNDLPHDRRQLIIRVNQIREKRNLQPVAISMMMPTTEMTEN